MNSLSIAIIIIIGFQVASYRNCVSLTRCKRLSSYWFSTSVILKLPLGAVHKGRPKRRGGGFGKMGTQADGGGGKRALRTSASWYFSLLFKHALQTLSLLMMPIKVQIVIHLIQFAPQSIIWAGTKDYIQLTLRVRLIT